MTPGDQDFLRKFARNSRGGAFTRLLQPRSSPVLALPEVGRSGKVRVKFVARSCAFSWVRGIHEDSAR